MKTAIVYCSVHHGNTKMLLDAIAALGNVDLIDATHTEKVDLSEYDRIGFASGVYHSKYHQSVITFAEHNLSDGKSVFFIHTAGDPHENQNAALKEITDAKGCQVLGVYCCKGFDTFGPFKLIGGISKGHPDQKDIDGAVEFYTNLPSA